MTKKTKVQAQDDQAVRTQNIAMKMKKQVAMNPK